MQRQHDFRFLPFIIVAGLLVGWGTGELAGALARSIGSAPYSADR
jgi:hypothetical protein